MLRERALAAATAASVLFSLPGTAQVPPAPVVELNAAPSPEPSSSQPGPGVAMGGVAWFLAFSAGSGRELWRSDGTAAGTWLVRETLAGFADAQPWYGPRDPVVFGSRVVFAGYDWAYGHELWESDGTFAGTGMLWDLEPGPGGGVSSWSRPCVFNGQLWFAGYDAARGHELWRWDGVAAQPAHFFEFEPGATGSSPARFVVAGTRMFFTATIGGVSWLCATDGTPAGTQALQRVHVEGGTALGSLFVFAGDAGGSAGFDREPWRSDGTVAGTRPLADLRPGAAGSDPGGFTEAGGAVWFAADDGVHGREVWRTDGTAAPVLAADLEPGPGGSDPRSPTALGGEVWFTASPPTGGPGLWRSSIGGGTARVQSFAQPDNAIVATLGNQLLLSVANAAGASLWRSDGTPAGTVFVHAVAPGSSVATLGNALLFAGDDGASGMELWRTDATAAGTVLVRDIDPDTGDADPAGLHGTPATDLLFFTADDGTNGRGLYASDGTAAGTRRLAGPSFGGDQHRTGRFAFLGPTFLFGAEHPVHGRELWRSDGTQAGTALVTDMNPAGSAFSRYGYADRFATLGGAVLFAADGGAGVRLWRSDGTAAGTFEVTTSPAAMDPEGLTRAGDLVFFATASGLFATDGTASGTRQLAAVAVGEPWEMCAVGSRLFFPGDDGVHGQELWVSDGSPGGTHMVVDLLPGPTSSYDLEELTAVGDVLFFTTRTVAAGRELWRSDGTAAGTAMVADIVPGPAGSGAWHLAAFGDQVLFFACDGRSGLEPWRSDGTAAGTQRIADVNPGAPSSDCPDYGGFRTLPGGSRALFPASDGAHGMELWVTDGIGAQRLADLWPGQQGSLARVETEFPFAGSRLWLPADDGVIGRELWSMPMFFAAARPFGDGCSGSNGRPQLRAGGPPLLGTTLSVRMERAAAGALAALGAGFAPAYAPLAAECHLLVANPTMLRLVTTDAAGGVAVPIALPADPALAQVQALFQMVVLDAAGPVAGFLNVSGGLQVVVDS